MGGRALLGLEVHRVRAELELGRPEARRVERHRRMTDRDNSTIGATLTGYAARGHDWRDRMWRFMVPALVACNPTGVDTDETGIDTDGCVPDDLVGVLEEHLGHVDSAIGFLAGHPGEREAVSLLEVPGFGGPLSYMTLIAPCTEAMFYEEYCDPATDLCSQIECTGSGASWVVHQRADGAFTSGDFAFAALTGDVRWEEGTEGFTWVTASEATTATADWSVGAGSGAVVPSGDSWEWSLSETFPGFASPSVLTVVHGPEGGSGELTAGSVILATVDETLGVTVTGECP
jgi:hypothetical protein